MSSQNQRLGIIVGIDDSPAAKVAIQWATREAELRNAPLTLVHAISPDVATWLNKPLPPGLARWQRDHGHQLVEDALKVIEEAAERGGPAGLGSEIVPPAAVPALVDMSKDAEMVVTGCHGSGRWPDRPLAQSVPGCCATRTVRWPSSTTRTPRRRIAPRRRCWWASTAPGHRNSPPAWPSMRHRAAIPGWWRRIPGVTSMSRNGRESIGRQRSRWQNRYWPSAWRDGKSNIPM